MIHSDRFRPFGVHRSDRVRAGRDMASASRWRRAWLLFKRRATGAAGAARWDAPACIPPDEDIVPPRRAARSAGRLWRRGGAGSHKGGSDAADSIHHCQRGCLAAGPESMPSRAALPHKAERPGTAESSERDGTGRGEHCQPDAGSGSRTAGQIGAAGRWKTEMAGGQIAHLSDQA